jgi:hypothetical protein
MRKYGIAVGTALAVSSLVAGGSVINAQGDASSSSTTASSSIPPAPAPAAAGTSNVTLPLLASSLTVAITSDVGGGLLDVSLGGTATGLDLNAARPGKVSFVNEAGTVKVKVSAKDGGEKVEVRAGSLGDISGPGGWSGDVFGTGETTSVAFAVGAGSDGGPDITGITVNSPAEFTIGAVERSTDTDDHDGEIEDGEIEQRASFVVSFAQAGQTRTLKVKAEVETDDGRTRSELKISLGRIKGRQIADGPAVGPHTWSGQLCDGTAASFTYEVTAEGQIINVVPTPAADIDLEGDEAKVRFSGDDRVKVEVDEEDGTLVVRVREGFDCDRVMPTVDGSTVPTTVDDDDGHHGDDDDDDHHGRGRHDDDDDDDDDGDDRTSSTSTTVADPTSGVSTSTTIDDDRDDDDDDDDDDGDHDGDHNRGGDDDRDDDHGD